MSPSDDERLSRRDLEGLTRRSESGISGANEKHRLLAGLADSQRTREYLNLVGGGILPADMFHRLGASAHVTQRSGT